jgi:hypothetical protein
VVTPFVITIDKVAVLESVAFVARIVKVVELIDAVGVPAILPFELLKVKPAGSVGETVQLLAVPPLFVAVTAVIALLTVAVIVAALRVMLGARSTSLTVTVYVDEAVFALPELSNTAVAPTLRFKLPDVADMDESKIV